ncbi:hypothetical protein JTE90_018586 [Oedothorax gibbosus]|uniref:Uncharacterized protein n=1 Tax=Oedothorax gibbosus TaxID=931172 RepID=A0AAV6U5H2_9ARAC|nr:hypothetical protein JTE90_018586 [Oedothorax gibbosus]
MSTLTFTHLGGIKRRENRNRGLSSEVVDLETPSTLHLTSPWQRRSSSAQVQLNSPPPPPSPHGQHKKKQIRLLPNINSEPSLFRRRNRRR